MKKMNKAGRILLAGFCINLAIGILYAWSIFKSALVSDLGWTNAEASLPYTVAIVVFSAALLVAGILQDKMGPRKVLILGATLVGTGMILSSFALSPVLLIVTFGVITGTGIGFGYACLCPAAMKWFHPSKKGFVNGVITAGFGLGAVYLAPLTSALIGAMGISTSFLILGGLIIATAVPLACTIDNPPADYKPEAAKGASTAATVKLVDLKWTQMLTTPQFYMLWIMFAFASSAGLMIIGNMTSIASAQVNVTDAAYLVSIIAIFNCLGRFGGGVLSDKIGGIKTLMIAFLLQGANMLMFSAVSAEIGLILGAILAGAGYGMLLSVFPTMTAEYYGLKNYGTNYGVLYTAWGFSGFLGPVIAAYALDTNGTFELAYTASAALVGVALVLAFIIKPVDAAKIAQTEDDSATPDLA